MFYKLFTKLSPEIIAYSNLLIKDAESKHIAQNTPKKYAKIYEQKSILVNYDYCFMSLKDNYNILDNQQYVLRMSKSPNFRPAKYIIDKTGRIWADNTHTSLSILVRHGINATINSANYYFVDLRKGNMIFQPTHLPILSDDIYIEIINNSLKLQQRLDNGWRPLSLSYTIGDLFLQDNYDRLFKSTYTG